MKKLIAVIICLMLAASGSLAEIRLAESADIGYSRLSDAGIQPKYAFLNPTNGCAYYIMPTDAGIDAMAYDFTDPNPKKIMSFDGGIDLVAISADADGNVYLLTRALDETAKSGMLRVVEVENGYAATEYLYPGATSALTPISMSFSAISSGGFTYLKLTGEGAQVNALSVFNIFWDALEGYNELVFIEPGKLAAQSIPMADLYDAYGYPAQEADELFKKLAAGELLAPTNASISPNGDMLLITVQYQGETLLYIMDIYSLSLELLYPPDGFSGEIGWTYEGLLYALTDGGETIDLEFDGFSDVEWDSQWGTDWTDGEEGGWAGAITDDWNDVDDGNLDDWS